MSKKSTFHRTTIRIPMDLKERMDEVMEDISWSALACHTFENKLAEIAARKENAMDDIIERIRKSKAVHEGLSFREGENVGRRWAAKYAQYQEFGWLDGLSKKVPELVKKWHFDGFAHTLDPAGSTVYKVESEFKYATDRPDEIDFSSFLRGFFHGALGVWNAVKDKL